MAVSTQDNNFKLKNSMDRGAGVISKKPFSAGEVVMRGAINEILSVNTVHTSQIGENAYVNPIGLMAFVNHCCNPNCGIQVNEAGAHDYVAMRDISTGDEITFDYAMQNYCVDHFPSQCLCGAEDCRGEIGGWQSLPQDKKEQYQGFVAPYLLELDAKHSL